MTLKRCVSWWLEKSWPISDGVKSQQLVFKWDSPSRDVTETFQWAPESDFGRLRKRCNHVPIRDWPTWVVRRSYCLVPKYDLVREDWSNKKGHRKIPASTWDGAEK